MKSTNARFPELDPLDRRLVACRSDLADVRLKGKVEAARFMEGEAASICVPLCNLREQPDPDCPLDHQLLLGMQVRVFDHRDGWVWIQCEEDSYVGWTRADAVADGMSKVTHMVSATRTFAYPDSDMKLPISRSLSMGSKICVVGAAETRSTSYVLLENGEALIARHVRSLESHETDYVAVAERFLETPYLWGGSSCFGLDCSGMVQLAMRMCGKSVLRDSDMQAATIGESIEPGEDFKNLQRGDLVFWRGHVAIYDGEGNLLHANGYTMDVTREPLVTALGRISSLFEDPIGYRRP